MISDKQLQRYEHLNSLYIIRDHIYKGVLDTGTWPRPLAWTLESNAMEVNPPENKDNHQASTNYLNLQIVAVMESNKNTKVRSFNSSENIQKKESGSDCTTSNKKFSSVTLNELAIKAR